MENKKESQNIKRLKRKVEKKKQTTGEVKNEKSLIFFSFFPCNICRMNW